MRNDYGYIDIHAHILPEVDDGAKSIDETRAMLRMAYDQGVRTIIATPHADSDSDKDTSYLLHQLTLVREEAFKIDNNFQIYLGNEIYYENGCLTKLKQGKIFTMAESRYVLVEFHPQESYNIMYEGMRNFILEGYIPIIAHIERYGCLRKKENRIQELIELGCYMQVNAKSLSGGLFDFESAYLRKLVVKGLVHIIATDCHNNTFRPPVIEECVKKLLKCVDEEKIKCLLFDNPKKILEDQYI